MSFKRLNITSVKVANVPRGASSPVVAKRIEAQKVIEKFENTAFAKKIAARNVRATLNDFDRFKLMIAKKQVITIQYSYYQSIKENRKILIIFLYKIYIINYYSAAMLLTVNLLSLRSKTRLIKKIALNHKFTIK